MRTHTIIAPLALIAGRLAAGPAAHAAPAPARAAMTPPSTPAELVHDLRAVLLHAGFRAWLAHQGIPGRAPFIRAVEWINYSRPPIRAHVLGGFDPLYDYLSTSLARWGGAHRPGRLDWVWRDSAVDESVTLIYQPAGGGARRPRPEAELIIVHYTPPTGR